MDMKQTEMMVNGKEAIDFFEKIIDYIAKEHKDDAFFNKYTTSMNRVRYETRKGIGKKQKVVKAIYRSYNVKPTCGHCGCGITEAWHKFCPNCGTRIIK